MSGVISISCEITLTKQELINRMNTRPTITTQSIKIFAS